MLENLIFSVSRVAPFFLLIVLGGYFRMRKIVPETFFQLANNFVYKIALPLNLFLTIATPAESVTISARFLWFIALGTLGMYLLIWGVTELLFRDKTIVGTLVQGGFRGNFALLGLPLVTAVAGASAGQLAAFAIIAVIPLYNFLSVVALMVRGNAPGRPQPLKILREVATNPLIVATLLAMPLFLLRIRLPYFAEQTLGYITQTATPLGLLSIGGLFRLADATARLRPALYASLFKNLIQPALLVPLGMLVGLQGEELLVLFVLTAAPGAVSAYPMACALGGDGPLASNTLILTTFFSAFVFAAGIYLMRAFGLI